MGNPDISMNETTALRFLEKMEKLQIHQSSQIDYLNERVRRHEKIMEALAEENDGLAVRIAALEAAGPRIIVRTVDPINDKILAYMKKHPGMKLTANVLAENIGEDNGVVGSRLKSLFGNGRISKKTENGKVAMYYYSAEPKEDGV